MLLYHVPFTVRRHTEVTLTPEGSSTSLSEGSLGSHSRTRYFNTWYVGHCPLFVPALGLGSKSGSPFRNTDTSVRLSALFQRSWSSAVLHSLTIFQFNQLFYYNPPFEMWSGIYPMSKAKNAIRNNFCRVLLLTYGLLIGAMNSAAFIIGQFQPAKKHEILSSSISFPLRKLNKKWATIRTVSLPLRNGGLFSSFININ